MKRRLVVILSTFFLSTQALASGIIELSCPDLANESAHKFKVVLAEDYLVENSGTVLRDQAEISRYDRSGKLLTLTSEDTQYAPDRNPYTGKFIIGLGSVYAENGFLKITRDTSGSEPSYSAMVIGENYMHRLEPYQKSDCELVSSRNE